MAQTREEAFKSLNFLQMMIDMGMVCEDCGDKPSFPDGWYFIPSPEAASFPIVCPTCMEKKARK